MTEQEQFADWMESQFPGLGAFFNDFFGDTWQQSEHYLFWVAQGKPTGTGETLTPEQQLQRDIETERGFTFGEQPGGTGGLDQEIIDSYYGPMSVEEREVLAQQYKSRAIEFEEQIAQIAGQPPGTHPSMITNNPEIWNSLTPEEQAQILELAQKSSFLLNRAIGISSLSAGEELAGLSPEEVARRYPTPKMPTIPTPNWLPQLVPGLTAGSPLELSRAKLPSAQIWNRLSDTQKQMFGGFVEATGGAGLGGPQTYADVVSGIQRRLPRQRTKAARWQPALQTGGGL